MTIIFTSKVFEIIFWVVIILMKVLYAVTIFFKCKYDNKRIRNVITFLSILFPIIIGIVCIIKYKKSTKDAFIILITLILYLFSIIAVGAIHTNSVQEKYYDKEGKAHTYASDITFTDTDGNKYTFDFEKTGYDYLYINGTDERLDANLCYLDRNGYIHYDDDLSITAKDETSCVDEDGSIYYPAKYTTFNKNGSINYSFDSDNFKYDRFGNAYTYDYVPYYDSDGNKYFYSFDSNTQKGTYTNISTRETFENEYSFVDENGYFVYDKEHSFKNQKDIENVKTYKDSSGKTYYWASGVSWDKNGNLLNK